MMWMTAIWALALPEMDQKPKNPAKTRVFGQKPTTHGQNTKNPGFFTTLVSSETSIANVDLYAWKHAYRSFHDKSTVNWYF